MTKKNFTDPLECFQEGVTDWARDMFVKNSNIFDAATPLPANVSDITADSHVVLPPDPDKAALLQAQDIYNNLRADSQYIFVRALVRHEKEKVMEALKELKGTI